MSKYFKREDDDFLVSRDIYRDEEIFELEMEHIFEGTWNLIGLESQVPKTFDYFTTYIGRTPVMVTRARDGSLNCVINSCTHKGAMICHNSSGNSRTFVCDYHGWGFAPDGKNILVKNKDQGEYPKCFGMRSQDLVKVAKFANYRGFLFASLNPDTMPLEDYLGDFKVFLDLLVERSADGLECVSGMGIFTYKGNWKLQMENGVDAYHFSSTHPSYIKILKQRGKHTSVYSTFDSNELVRGCFSFENGHNVMWGTAPANTPTPYMYVQDEVKSRLGEVKAKWMSYIRNATFFPNAQLAENAALQLRIFRPISVGLTEMRTYCLAPKGEPVEARKLRVRQYEEFFNPTGLATPDDIVNYEDCQRGMAAKQIKWQQGHSRGSMVKSTEVPEAAKEIGVKPILSAIGGFNLGDETIMHSTYTAWENLLNNKNNKSA